MTNVSSVMAVSCMMNGLVLHRWSTRQFFKGSVWETVTSDRRSIEYTLKYLVKCFFFHSFQSDQLAAFQFCTRAFFPFCFFYIIQSSSVYLFVCLFHEVSVVVFIVFFALLLRFFSMFDSMVCVVRSMVLHVWRLFHLKCKFTTAHNWDFFFQMSFLVLFSSFFTSNSQLILRWGWNDTSLRQRIWCSKLSGKLHLPARR